MAAARKRGSEESVSGGARAFVTLDDLLRLKQRAHGFSFLPRQPVHSLLAGQHGSRLRGRGLNFEELRRYVIGDDTRTIDWLATARLRAPHVRVYTEERDRPVLLLVDQRSSMFFGSRGAMKSVAAAEAAALAAWRVTSLGDRIGAIIFGDREMVEIGARGREPGAVRVLAEVARQNHGLLDHNPHSNASGALNLALRRAAHMTTHDWLVCLITDAAGADDATNALTTEIMAHNDLLAIYVHDPLEEELPDIGLAPFAWGDQQMEVDTSSAALRQRFADQQKGWRGRLAQLSRQRAVPVLPISTEHDVGLQLRALIGQRQQQAISSLPRT